MAAESRLAFFHLVFRSPVWLRDRQCATRPVLARTRFLSAPRQAKTPQMRGLLPLSGILVVACCLPLRTIRPFVGLSGERPVTPVRRGGKGFDRRQNLWARPVEIAFENLGESVASSTKLVGSAVISQALLTARFRSSRTVKRTGSISKNARTRRSTSATSTAMMASGLSRAAVASRCSEVISRTHGSHHVAKKCTRMTLPARACRSRRSPRRSSSEKAGLLAPSQIFSVIGGVPCDALEEPGTTSAPKQAAAPAAARIAKVRLVTS